MEGAGKKNGRYYNLNLNYLKRKSVLPFKPVTATLLGAKAHSSTEP